MDPRKGMNTKPCPRAGGYVRSDELAARGRRAAEGGMRGGTEPSLDAAGAGQREVDCYLIAVPRIGRRRTADLDSGERKASRFESTGPRGRPWRLANLIHGERLAEPPGSQF